MSPENLLPGPAPTLLPDDPGHDDLDAGIPAVDVAAAHPASSAAWATLADEAFGRGAVVESYAYARTGYHRGLDSLRRSGWRGQGPVPSTHRPNQGFLHSLEALGRAAAALGETDEAQRCAAFRQDCDG